MTGAVTDGPTQDCDILVSVSHPVMRHFIASEIRAIQPEANLRSGNLELTTLNEFRNLVHRRQLPPVIILEDRYAILNDQALADLAGKQPTDTRWLIFSRDDTLSSVRASKDLRLVSEGDEPGEIRAALNWALEALQGPQIHLDGLSDAGGDARTNGASAGNQTEKLSTRQRQIMSLIAKGCSNKQVAAELGIREGTVKAHLFSAYRCYGVNNRTQATLQYLTDIGADSGK